MKRKYLLLSFLFFAVLIIMNTPKVSSNNIFPLPGEVNDPTSPVTCAQSGCHPSPVNQSVFANSGGLLNLQIADSVNYQNTNFTLLNSAFKYVPDSTYWIEFNIENSDSTIFGFEMTALDSLNDSMAGSFTVINSNNTSIHESPTTQPRQYISHLHANSNLTWIFKWNAPAIAMPVTFYFAYNTSDTQALNANIPEGKIYNGTLSIDPVGGYAGINNISNFVTNLRLYPNPTNNDFNVSFSLKQSENVSLDVYSVDGQITRKLMDNEKRTAGLFNQSFDISDLPAGIYLVKLNTGSASVTRKITKQ